MGHRDKNPETEVHTNKGPPEKDRNISNKQPNPTSTRIGGTNISKAQSK